MAADHLAQDLTESSYEREKDVTHTIDDIPHYVESDRDDGIRVERLEHGYRVHVTISDVAAYVPFTSSPLADAAWKRGFTVYNPEQTDHMLEENLVYRMSLEHEKPRLGMRVSIDLDEQFQPQGTKLTKTIVTPDSNSYEDAAQKMKTDEQFKLMAKIARGLRAHYFTGAESDWEDVTDIPHDELPEGRPIIRENQSEAEIKATKLVEVYMLLANSAVASLFAQSDLPFAYRNFSEHRPAKDGKPQRAYYSTDWHGHTELEKIGLTQAYCHFTSPIRRGPDYFNSRMAHYAIANMERLRIRCEQNFTLSAEQVRHLEEELWHHAAAYLEVWGAPTDSMGLDPKPFLEGALEAVGVPLDEITSDKLEKIEDSAFVHGLPIPISKDDLQRKLENINTLSDLEADRLEAFDVQHALMMAYKRDILQSLSAETCERMVDDQFSARLHDAAVTGFLPAPLYKEALKRIKGISSLPPETTLEKNNGDHTKLRMNQVHDALSILIEAPYARDPKWIELKKSMCRAIHDKPGIFRTLFSHAFEEHMVAGKTTPPVSGFHARARSTYIPVDGDEATRERNIAASICVLEKDGQELSAPTYSIGHDTRAAESHAYFSFIEHFAFSQLRPLDHSMIPNLLYAELDSDEVSKRALVEKMLEGTGTELTPTTFTQHSDGRWFARIHARGGALNDPIPLAAISETQHGAEDRALARLLRNPIFRKTFAFKASPELHAQVNPRQMLANKAEEHNCLFEPERDIHVTTATNGFNRGFKATVTIMDVSNCEVTSYTPWEIEPNKDRAINRACMQVLHQKGWINQKELDEAPASWVERAASAPKIDVYR